MTDIKTILHEANHMLSDHSSTARLDAEVLLAFTLNVNRSFLYAHGTDQLSDHLAQRYHDLCVMRRKGHPIAYLTGVREFWSLPLCVNEATLIPRPDTELLVEKTLALLHHKPSASLLELGTGSGAVVLALAKERPQWSFWACDKYEETLDVARGNANQLNLKTVNFILSDWFESIPSYRFDAIISNPPYLAEDDPHQHLGDLRFEPKHALISGQEGLDDIRHIIETGPDFLKPNGFLMLEHGFDQEPMIKKLFQDHHYTNISSFYDIENRMRVTAGFR